jgi:hypothetical protein
LFTAAGISYAQYFKAIVKEHKSQIIPVRRSLTNKKCTPKIRNSQEKTIQHFGKPLSALSQGPPGEYGSLSRIEIPFLPLIKPLTLFSSRAVVRFFHGNGRQKALSNMT